MDRKGETRKMKRIFSMVLVLCMLAGMLLIPAAATDSGGQNLSERNALENIAQNKPVVGENNYHNEAAYGPQKAVDGNRNSRWSAQDNKQESSLTVDFQGKYEVTGLTIIQCQGRIRTYHVETRKNGQWTKVLTAKDTHTGTADNKIEVMLDAPVVCDSLRVRFDTDAVSTPTIWALQIWGKKEVSGLFAVTFDTQGGNQMEPVSVERNTAVSEPVAPSREGHTFLGWYTDPDCTVAYDFAKPVQEALTLYAGWVKGNNCEVRITDVQHTGENVKITGTSKNLGVRKVEIIINDDLEQRYVAKTLNDQGDWQCEVKLHHNGQYEIAASIRSYDDFSKLLQTTPDNQYFQVEDRVIWGATVSKGPDDLYYMVFSTWHNTAGFGSDWAVRSELGYAVSNNVNGPYVYQGLALDASYCNTTNKKPVYWEGVGELQVFHNPTMIHSEKDGKYYLYFMGTNASEGGYTYGYSRNHQRIGCAYADTPAGPWTVVNHPVIDVRPGMYDSLLVSNPSVAEIKNADGTYTYQTIYKAVENRGGYDVVVSGCGYSDSPLGPFTRSDEPVMQNPKDSWSVEDCFIWYGNGRINALAKDFKSYFTGVPKDEYPYSCALFEAYTGMDWTISEYPLAFVTEIPWARGPQKVSNLERAQVYVEDGTPMLLCAATTKTGGSPSSGTPPINVQIPLLGVLLKEDVKSLEITDLTDKAVNLKPLQAKCEEARKAEKHLFKGEDWQKLQSALTAADRILQDSRATAEDVEFALAQVEKFLSRQVDPSDIPVNIALHKPVEGTNTYRKTAAGVPTKAYIPEKAVDGNMGSRWATQTKGVESSLTVDLQGLYRIDGFTILQSQPRIRTYHVEVFNGDQWTIAKPADTMAKEKIEYFFDTPVEGNKIKLILDKDAVNPPSIWEFQVWGKEKLMSSDAALKSLTLDAGTLQPDFSSEVTAYTAEVSAGTAAVTISAEPASKTAVITGTGDIALECGKNSVAVTVTAEDGITKKTYTISIHRPHDLQVHAKEEATCTVAGAEAYWSCKTCEKLFSDASGSTEITEPEVISALGHQWGQWTVVKEPGLYAAGLKERICGRCGEKATEEIPALLPDDGHTPHIPVKPVKPEKPTEPLPFVDVPEHQWYYDSVYSAWEQDLIDGMDQTHFAPDSTLTVAQAIKLAAVLHQRDKLSEVTLTNGAEQWYETYVKYAIANGIIEEAYADYTAAQMNAAITRNEFVHIFHGALDYYSAINEVADNAIPDVKMQGKYAAEIYEFYRADILTGSDEAGTFYPNTNIKRSEVATILIRMYDVSERVYISLQ